MTDYFKTFVDWLTKNDPTPDYPTSEGGRPKPSQLIGPNKIAPENMRTYRDKPGVIYESILPPETPLKSEEELRNMIWGTPTSDQSKVPIEIQELLDPLFKRSTPADVEFIENMTSPSTRQVPENPVGAFLDYVGQLEGSGDYDIIYGGKRVKNLTGMTIQEVLDAQKKRSLPFGKGSTAVGKFQFIPETLAIAAKQVGLDPATERFTPANQRKMAEYLLRSRRGFDSYLSGSIGPEELASNLAREWAALPSPEKGGKSHYQGKAGNKALVSLDELLEFLKGLR
jgi:muramidase (phage lysozyme)